MLLLEVTIRIASTWPSCEELAARNRVEDVLDAACIGTCIGAGGGMAEMHLAYRVADESAARGYCRSYDDTHGGLSVFD
jgi:hypothetical protein